ncbi:unnamed protein product [Ilex paraguariensis]|uniref:Uncharacterized protein n=1 Tax=Ilex paraguariensis TaxID=185542 RepID=A0ABC8RGM4_9AQUA
MRSMVAATDTRGKHWISAELKRFGQEVRFLELRSVATRGIIPFLRSGDLVIEGRTLMKSHMVDFYKSLYSLEVPVMDDGLVDHFILRLVSDEDNKNLTLIPSDLERGARIALVVAFISLWWDVMVAWHKVCALVEEGGLGVRDFFTLNQGCSDNIHPLLATRLSSKDADYIGEGDCLWGWMSIVFGQNFVGNSPLELLAFLKSWSFSSQLKELALSTMANCISVIWKSQNDCRFNDIPPSLISVKCFILSLTWESTILVFGTMFNMVEELGILIKMDIKGRR